MTKLRLIPLILLTSLLSCQSEINFGTSKKSSFLGGSISALNGIVSHDADSSLIPMAYANPVCGTSVFARIYAILPDGTMDTTALASVEVSGGRYGFSKDALASLPASTVSHQVVIEGCDQYLSRPITDLNLKQDVTYQSSLVASVANAALNKTLYQTDRGTVRALIDSLSGPSVLGTYANLNSSVTLSNQFASAFADAPVKLLDSHPVVILGALPTMGNEGLTNHFEVSAIHFDPGYAIAYEWHLDGVEQSTSAQWNFIPSADSSGNHTVTLFVGLDSGSAHVDRTKPFYVVNKNFQIIDTLPATPIDFTVPAVTNLASVSVSALTGTSLANCASFKFFLLTESLSAPGPSDSGFTRTCTTSVSQTEAFTLSSGDGTKTIYLWTKDSAGNVSSSSQSHSVLLDTILPSLSLSGVGALYGGGKTLSLTYGAADLESGLFKVELFLSYGGSAYAKVKDLSFSGTTDSFALPVTDAADATVRIVATDLAGNIQTATSGVFTIDSTPPAAPTITLTSPSNTNSATLTFAATCTGISDLLIGEAVSASDTTGWVTCAATLSSVITATTQGNRAIKVFARDAVGNVSAATTINVNFDSVIPTATITAQPAALSSETSFNFQFSGTDNITSAGSLTFQCALNSGAYGTCSSPSATSGFIAGYNTFHVRSVDQSGNVSVAASYTWDHNTSQPTLAYTSVTSLSPAHSNSLAARSITVGGTSIASYKYTVIRSGACSAVDFSALSEITLTGNQTFSFTPTTDGTYQVCGIGKSTYGVWQLDANASASPVLTIDTVVPSFSSLVLAPGPFGTSTTPSVSGVTKLSSTVTLHLDSPTCASAPLSSVVANASTGTFSLTATALSADAPHNYYVKSTDDSGNTLCSSALPYTLDRVNPVVTLTYLDGGEVVKGAQVTNLTWTATDTNMAATPITLEYSLNNGVNWTQIATNQTNSGTYAWNMPGFNSATAKIRITAIDKAGNTFVKESAATFTIDSSAPIVVLTSLTGGQILKAGSNQLINWTASDTNTTGNWITLSYSSNSGTSWTVITSTTNTGSYSWTVPAAVNSSTYRVKVTATDRVGQITEAASTSNFIIDATNPTVALTSFTGGQAVLGNSYQTITWSAGDANFGSTPISLELSSNSGSTWSSIASNLPNTGSYSWQTNVPDGNNYRVRVIATDAAGLFSTSASTSDFVVSTQAPNLSQTLKASPFYSNTATSVTFGGTCDNGYAINITGQETTSTTCSSGTWSWTSATQSTDGIRTYNFSQTNSVLTLTISAVWVRDTVAPSVSAVSINNGNTQTPAPTVSVAVTTPETGIFVRFANAVSSASSCQSLYADNNWRAQSALTSSFNQILSSGDGVKKICVWAKDPAGNVSVISPATGTQDVDMDTITYASGNPPVVISFDVVNDGGGAFQGMNEAYQNDPLKITWNVSDVESLDNNPIMIDYTLDGSNWTAIESGYGGLSGNPTTYSFTYYGFSAPSSSFFRVRIRVKDSAGNISSELMSKAFNTSPWTVIAGGPGRGVGGSAKSARVFRNQTQYGPFAMSPINGDVYFIDHTFGLKKMSGATGIVSMFIPYGNYNLGSSGTISSASRVDTRGLRVYFDFKGFLYLFTENQYLTQNADSERVLRLNPSTQEYTTYLGRGTSNSTGANPTDTFVFQANGVAFDESNSMYFLSSCTPGVMYVRGGSTSNTVLMKVTQNSDGTPGSVTRIAGNCTRGIPTSGVSALSNPFNNANDGPWDITLAVWGNGRYIYYTDGQANGYKIIDGITYQSTIGYGTGFMVYNSVTGKLITSAGTVRTYTPSLSGDNGEVLVTSMDGNGTGLDCGDDGVASTLACGRYFGGTLSSSGKFFFADGEEGALAKLKYLDDNDKVQTLIGSKAFSGEGQAPSNAKGSFGGIYYKKSTDPLSFIYPEGLYFLERFGGIFGYFTSSNTIKITGNQSGSSPQYSSAMTTSDSLGPVAQQNLGALSGFTFAQDGTPWFRFNYDKVGTLDSSKYLINKTPSAGSYWNVAAEGEDPRTKHLYPFGTWHNVTIKNNGKLFLMGSFYDATSVDFTALDNKPKIRIHDFENNVIKHVIGNQPMANTPQQTSEGSLKNSSLGSCLNNDCSINYDQSTDRLYFSEYNRLRYITNPEDPNHHTLIDIFTTPLGAIGNFSISPNHKYIMYVANGHLYCHAVSAADDSLICKNNPANHIDLGPPNGLSYISKGPNQMTWKNDGILYISTYEGEIYQYILYH
jgi:large repetitive protein